jgi:3-oxosteroid 1-dehydrogenase
MLVAITASTKQDTNTMSSTWDHQTDLLVIGAGAAGMASALTASTQGLQVLVIEKTECYGGTTALSGGVIWIPNNSLMKRAGMADSTDDALAYLKHNIGNRVGETKLQAFVSHAAKMLDHLCDNGFLEVLTFEGFPDYRPEDPGGAASARSVEPKVLAGRKLGASLAQLRARSAIAPGGIVGTMTELRRLAAIRSNPLEVLKAWKVFPRNLWNRLSGASHLSNGAALAGWLRLGLAKREIPLWLNTALTELIVEDGTVVGVAVTNNGEPQRIRATKGVVISAGGFEHNPEMRRQFFGAASTSDYTSGAPGNTGDGINAGIAAGAAVDLMDDAWWAPTFMPPEQGPQIVIFERGKPGNIIVNGRGQRFANEADPYNEFVKQMQEADGAGTSAIPAHMIFDSTYRNRYPLGGMLPGITPKRLLDSGFVSKADTLEALAGKIGVDPSGLATTVKNFNDMAHNGTDNDFHKGESAFDRFAGDPTVKPNPCLAPLDQAPFYAMKLYPGDLGTKGGLQTNEHAQVVRDDGTVVAGLYAAGNSSASAMGNFYPGAGGTIGPAMTFGYIAAMHAAGQNPG